MKNLDQVKRKLQASNYILKRARPFAFHFFFFSKGTSIVESLSLRETFEGAQRRTPSQSDHWERIDFDSGLESSWPPKIKHNININSSISQKSDNPVIINTIKTTPGIKNVRSLSFRWLGNK